MKESSSTAITWLNKVSRMSLGLRMGCRVVCRVTVALVVFSLVACKGGEKRIAVHHYMSPTGMGWSITDTLLFTVPPMRETGNYDFSLGMRLGVSFPYAGVWIAAQTQLHNPDSTACDTLYFVTMRKGGMPQGAGINLQQDEQKLTTMHLREGQSAEVYVHHIMRREVLPAVLDVGLLVERR